MLKAIGEQTAHKLLEDYKQSQFWFQGAEQKEGPASALWEKRLSLLIQYLLPYVCELLYSKLQECREGSHFSLTN